jgi:hypothetical protein
MAHITATQFKAGAVGLLILMAGVFPTISWAHCDTTDGPVVTDAKIALDTKTITPVLKWITAENEPELKTAFTKAIAARSSGKEAKDVADQYFFETLVRLHRTGEGAGFTGLKPAGSIEPSVAAADKEIEMGSIDGLAKELGKAAEGAVRERYGKVVVLAKHKDESVAAGREYVQAYVEYVHFVESLHDSVTATGSPHEHAK